MSQKLVFLVWITFLLIIMTYPSSLVSQQFFCKISTVQSKPLNFPSDFVYEAVFCKISKNLDLSLYECNFPKTMQDTETKI